MQKMFKSMLWALSLGTLLSLCSCSEQGPVVVKSVTLSTSGVVFDADGGSSTIAVMPFPEDVMWSVETSDGDWYQISVEEAAICVEAEVNQSSEMRHGEFFVVSPDGAFEPIEVDVMQEAAATLSYSTTAADCYNLDSEGGRVVFSVECNHAWGASADEAWIQLSVDADAGRVILDVKRNEGEELLSADVLLWFGEGEQRVEKSVEVNVGTRVENPYYKLVGQWEITATKWFYSPNGSLNTLDYAPNAEEYYLIFDLEEGSYGETLVMSNFLYPGTRLEVRYNEATGGIVIPFGWSVLYYDVFFYVTLVSSTQFAYAALEVDALPNSDVSSLTLNMPSVDGYNYVGFGLWTYGDDGSKVALGSNYRPTMFPMGEIRFVKR